MNEQSLFLNTHLKKLTGYPMKVQFLIAACHIISAIKKNLKKKKNLYIAYNNS